MQLHLNKIWWMLLILTSIFVILYLWHTLFPGTVRPEAFQYFQEQEISEGRSYISILRLVFILSFILELVLLFWFLGSGRAETLSQQLCRVSGNSLWGGRLLFFIILWLLLRFINLPFSLFAGYYWEHRWGFSTQTLPAWWQDYFLSVGLDFSLTLVGVLLFFVAIDRWPRKWWLAGAAFTSVWLFIQVFLWPLVISPLFNKFEPAQDSAVVQMVEELSEKAGLEVGEVLIMDASRRTTAANAYFTGLGKTKRIVLYDTLLKDYPPEEVKAVVAHEMAHWKHAHVLQAIKWGIISAFFLWGLLYLILGSTVSGRGGYPPHTWAIVVLFLLMVTFLSSPVENYLSRRMEKEADCTAVMLTGNIPVAIRLQVDLAAKNLADVSPPPFLEWFGYSHPSTLKRIEIIKQVVPSDK